MASPRSYKTIEHHKALTDYTATNTEEAAAEEKPKITIMDSYRDIRPKPILKSSQDNSDVEQVSFMN